MLEDRGDIRASKEIIDGIIQSLNRKYAQIFSQIPDLWPGIKLDVEFIIDPEDGYSSDEETIHVCLGLKDGTLWVTVLEEIKGRESSGYPLIGLPEKFRWIIPEVLRNIPELIVTIERLESKKRMDYKDMRELIQKIIKS